MTLTFGEGLLLALGAVLFGSAIFGGFVLYYIRSLRREQERYRRQQNEQED